MVKPYTLRVEEPVGLLRSMRLYEDPIPATSNLTRGSLADLQGNSSAKDLAQQKTGGCIGTPHGGWAPGLALEVRLPFHTSVVFANLHRQSHASELLQLIPPDAGVARPPSHRDLRDEMN